MRLVSDIISPFQGFRQGETLLSVDETIYINRLTDARRIDKWYTGRVTAKYLFLEYLDAGQPPAFSSLEGFTINDITRFPTSAYKAVEILPEKGAKGRPFIYHDGEKQLQSISLSYSGAYIVGLCSASGFVGIDIEQVTERRPEFYTHNFSPFEADYIHGLCESNEQKVWLYTVLWTIKEAGLKASADTRWNLWNLPMMEIDLTGAEGELTSLYRKGSKSININARIKVLDGYAQARLAVHQLNDEIITALYYE